MKIEYIPNKILLLIMVCLVLGVDSLAQVAQYNFEDVLTNAGVEGATADLTVAGGGTAAYATGNTSPNTVKAYSFNGTDNNLSSTWTGITGTAARSASVWVNLAGADVTAAGGMTIFEWGTKADLVGFELRVADFGASNPTLRFEAGGTTARAHATNGVVADGTWHHVAITFPAGGSSANVKLYLDGVLIVGYGGTSAAAFPNTTAGSFRIGSDLNGARKFKGLMDDFRIYDVELSAAEISTISTGAAIIPPVTAFSVDNTTPSIGEIITFTETSTNTPTTYLWDFGDATAIGATDVANPQVSYQSAGTYTVTLTASNGGGSDPEVKTDYITVTESAGTGNLQLQYDFTGDVTDASAYGRDLVAQGALTPTFGNREGTGDAYTASGVFADHLASGYTGISGGTARTVTGWFKTTGTSRETIISWGTNAAGQMFNVMIENGVPRIEGGTSSLKTSNTGLNNDVWRHIAVTYDPSDGDKLSNCKIYVDGVIATNLTDAGGSFNSENTVINTNTTTNFLRIGSAVYSSYVFNGALDDIRIYDLALTAAQVSSVSSGTAIDLPVTEFSASNITPSIGEIVTFTETSTNGPISSYLWDFGSPTAVGATDVANPEVSYQAAGTYTVTLTTTNAGGSDPEVKTDYITVSAGAGSGELQLQYDFTNDVTDASTYSRDLVARGALTPAFTDREGTNDAYTTSGVFDDHLATGYSGISGDGARTVTAWFKTTATGSDREAIISWGANAAGEMFNVMIEDGVPRIEAGSSSLKTSNTALNSGLWRHIAVTYDPLDGDKLSDCKVYIDGILATNLADAEGSFNSETTVLNTNTTTNFLRVGSAIYSPHTFDGSLDDVRVYSKALTIGEITAIVGVAAPVAGFGASGTVVGEGETVTFSDGSTNVPTSWSWTFEGGNPATSTDQNPVVTYASVGNYQVSLTATNAHGTDTKTVAGYITVGDTDLHARYTFQSELTDASIFGRDLSVIGGLTPTYVNDHLGNAESAYQSPGEEAKYLTAAYKGIGANGTRTVTAWFKTTEGGTRKTIVAWGNNVEGKMFNVMIDGGQIRIEGGACSLKSTATGLDDDQWHHLGVTYDPADGDKLKDIKIYIDGTLNTNASDTDGSFRSEEVVIDTDNATNDLRIGDASYFASYFWVGSLADVRIYGTALSAEEIIAASGIVEPTAEFSAETVVAVGANVTFTDASTNSPTSWSWTFDGGIPATSTEQNPVVTYADAGTYQVALTVTNAAGSDTETKAGYITASVEAPVAAFSASATEVKEGASVTFTDASTNAPTSWSWTFEGGTPATSTEQNPIVSYAAAGTYEVALTATNEAGANTETKAGYIMVSIEAPVTAFGASAREVEEGGSITFSDTSTNDPTSWSWTFEGGTPETSTEQNPSVTYTTAGSYQVSLTTTNAGGSDTETKSEYITVAAILSIDKDQSNKILLYPNPIENKLSIKIGEKIKGNNEIRVSIYSLLGTLQLNEVYKAKNGQLEIDTNSIMPGINIVELNIEGRIEQYKIVKD